MWKISLYELPSERQSGACKLFFPSRRRKSPKNCGACSYGINVDTADSRTKIIYNDIYYNKRRFPYILNLFFLNKKGGGHTHFLQ